MNADPLGRNEEFSQLFIDGMGDGIPETREFVPIIYGQTVDEICKEWRFNHDAELQNITLKLYYEVKYHQKILCAVSGGYDSDIMLDTTQHITIYYNCIGAFSVPDRRKIPDTEITMGTRKGVAVSYSPDKTA